MYGESHRSRARGPYLPDSSDTTVTSTDPSACVYRYMYRVRPLQMLASKLGPRLFAGLKGCSMILVALMQSQKQDRHDGG